jgi:hypothetical protein
MTEIIDFNSWRHRSLRLCDTPVERYERAYLNWRLNPTRGTALERLHALLAVLRAREESR